MPKLRDAVVTTILIAVAASAIGSVHVVSWRRLQARKLLGRRLISNATWERQFAIKDDERVRVLMRTVEQNLSDLPADSPDRPNLISLSRRMAAGALQTREDVRQASDHLRDTRMLPYQFWVPMPDR